MKTLRVCLYGFVLATANLGSIIAGFIVYHLLKPANQIAVQVPVAAILSITAFVVWGWLIRRLPFKRLSLQGPDEFVWAYIVSLLWAPVIFVPIHYITQGYLTFIGNIVALLFFQLPVNGAAIVTAMLISFPKIATEANTGA
jgi:hypothetical protein